MENLKYNPGKGYKMVKRQWQTRRVRLARPVAVTGYPARPAPGSRFGVLPRGPLAVAARKTPSRYPASRLMQYRKRKNNPLRRNPPKMSLGGSGTFSNFMLARLPSKRVRSMKLVGAPNFDIQNTANQLVVKEGFQSAGDWSILNLDDVKRVATHVPGLSGTPQVPKRFVLNSCQCEFIITNSSLATAYVDIYDIVRRRDEGVNQNTAGPTGAWITGVNNQELTAGTNGYKVINSLPTDAALFRDYFKVKKRTHVSLSQGSTHRHHVTMKPNYLVDSNLLDNLSGDVTGLTCYTMIVAYGQPASIPSDSGAVVTSAAINIDVIQAKRTKFTYVQDNTVAEYIYDGLSSLTGEQIVSAGAGTIVANAVV